MSMFDQKAEFVQRLLKEAKAEQIGRLNEDKALTEKWKALHLLDGLSETKCRVRARLLENQAKYMKQKLLREANTDADIQGFISVAFPAVRRVLDKSMVEDFVSVQPLKGPAGLIYYIEYKFSTNKAGVGGYLDTNGRIYGDRTDPNSDQALVSSASGGLYNFNSAAYSRREVVSASFGTGSAANTQISASVLNSADHASLKLVKFDPDAVAAMADSKLTAWRFVGMHASASAGTAWASVPFNTQKADLDMLTSWVPLSASSTATNTGEPGVPVAVAPVTAGSIGLLRHLTARDGDDMVFFFSCSSSLVATGMANTIDELLLGASLFHASASMSFPVSQSISSVSGIDGSFTFAPAFESDFLSTSAVVIPEIDFDIVGKTINTETRKLRAKWSPELAQDINAFYSINAEEALTQVLTDHMAAEIQSEILTDLLQNAGAATYYWSRRPGEYLDKTTGAVASGSPDFTGHVQDWYRTLIETILEVAAQIEKRTVLGQANFLITSPEVCVILQNTIEWVALDEERGALKIGAVQVGSLNGGLKIYKHSYFPKNQILLGYKPEGNEIEDLIGGGYVYAPYVPIIVSPIVADPEDRTPRRMVMSRYATEMIRGDFYGKVIVRSLNMT